MCNSVDDKWWPRRFTSLHLSNEKCSLWTATSETTFDRIMTSSIYFEFQKRWKRNRNQNSKRIKWFLSIYWILVKYDSRTVKNPQHSFENKEKKYNKMKMCMMDWCVMYENEKYAVFMVMCINNDFRVASDSLNYFIQIKLIRLFDKN